jgi:tripartite-type tricarboxylate transporter receptor subunit TctC
MGGTVTETVQAYRDGAIEIIGVGGDSRAHEIPQVPTFKEQGYDFRIWAAERAIFTRSGTSADVLKILRDAIKKATEDPEYIQKCEEVGMRNEYIDPDNTLRDVNNLMEFFRTIK